MKYWELRANFIEAANELKEKGREVWSDEEEKARKEKEAAAYDLLPGVVDPVKAFHFCLVMAFGVAASAVMRLKLFFTPELCVVAAMAASPRVSSADEHVYSLKTFVL